VGGRAGWRVRWKLVCRNGKCFRRTVLRAYTYLYILLLYSAASPCRARSRDVSATSANKEEQWSLYILQCVYIFVCPGDKTENPNFDPPLGGVRYDSADGAVSAGRGYIFLFSLSLSHPAFWPTPSLTRIRTHIKYLSRFILTRERRSIRLHTHHTPILYFHIIYVYKKYNILGCWENTHSRTYTPYTVLQGVVI